VDFNLNLTGFRWISILRRNRIIPGIAEFFKDLKPERPPAFAHHPEVENNFQVLSKGFAPGKSLKFFNRTPDLNLRDSNEEQKGPRQSDNGGGLFTD